MLRDTKELILRETFNLLLEKGVSNVSMSDIKKRTGLGSGTIYYYFKSKDEIIRTSIDRYIFSDFKEVVYKSASFSGTAHEKLSHFLNTILCFKSPDQESIFYMDEPADLRSVYMLYMSGIHKDSLIADKYNEITGIQKELLFEIIEYGKKSGEIITELDTSETVNFIATIIKGIYLLKIESEEDIESLIESSLDYIWRAIGK